MDMVEKVARAIYEAEPFDAVRREITWADVHDTQKRGFRVKAVAAIEAMREPTPEMLAPEEVHYGYGCHVCGGLKEGYELMLDAALKCQEKA
jgi:hypothetical protein